jgi:5-dehydro-2-deoxygluconokinase
VSPHLALAVKLCPFENDMNIPITIMMNRLSRNHFLVVGRAGMDLYADPPGTRMEDAAQFVAALGGSAANSAAAIAKLGGKAALLTCLSDDAVGRFVTTQMHHYGIDGTCVFQVGGEARNSLAVVETRNENCQSVIYRNNAADFQLTKKQTDGVDLQPFGALIITGTCLAVEPSRAAVLSLMHRAKAADLPMILDVDYRPYSWPSRDEAMRICREAADLCDIIIGNDEEFDLLAGAKGGGLTLAKTYGQNAIAIHKMGERGSITFAGEVEFETPVFKVTALKPTGAGDAFLGGFCTSLASGYSLQDSVIRGSASAAIVVTRVGCAPACPTPTELNAFLLERSAS